MPGDPQPTLVDTLPPPRSMEELAERAALRGGQLALEGLTGLASKPGANRMAMISMMVSLATLAALGGYIIAHSIVSSKFERAIEGLVDVLSEQNPDLAKKFSDVERKMHRGE